jgi:hypothetical protein
MKKQFSFRFDEKAVKDWSKVATMENRSLTNLIETVMIQYANAKLIGETIKESSTNTHPLTNPSHQPE